MSRRHPVNHQVSKFHLETYSKRIEPILESVDQHCCILRARYICKKKERVVKNHVLDKGQLIESVESAWRIKFDNVVSLSRETWLVHPL